MINHGSMLNIPDIIGWTPLHIACYYKRPDVTLLLLKHGANLFTRDREGITPLDLVFDDPECLKVINNFLVFNKDITERTIINNNTNIESSILSNQSKNNIKRMLFNRGLARGSKSSNFSSCDFNEQDMESHEKTKRILKNYKFIPKKHKFYYSYKNNVHDFNLNSKDETLGRTIEDNNMLKIQKTKTSLGHDYLSSPRQQENNAFTKFHSLVKIKNEFDKENQRRHSVNIRTQSSTTLIKAPLVFPQMKPLNKLKSTEIREAGNKSEPTVPDTKIYPDSPINNKFNDLYMPSHPSDEEEDSFMFEDVSHFTKMKVNRIISCTNSHRQRNKSQVIDMNFSKNNSIRSNFNDETICVDNGENSFSISESLAHYSYNQNVNNEAIILSEINSKIFDAPETIHFLTNINLSEIFYKVFGCSDGEIDELICALLNYDFKFAFLLFLNLKDIENSKEKLINYLRNIAVNKNLLGLLISKRKFDSDDFNFPDLAYLYINSFDFEKTNLRDSLKKCLKSNFDNFMFRF
jgi:hypothetical protein